MHIRNISVRKLPDDSPVVYVDGKKLEVGIIDSIAVDFDKEPLPQTEIRLNEIPEFETDTDLTITVDPKTTRDCMKYLALQLQLDDAFREAWIASIASALADTESEYDNYKKAQHILNRIMD